MVRMSGSSPSKVCFFFFTQSCIYVLCSVAYAECRVPPRPGWATAEQALAEATTAQARAALRDLGLQEYASFGRRYRNQLSRRIQDAVNAENQGIIVAHRLGDASLLAATETIAAARRSIVYLRPFLDDISQSGESTVLA